jgi:hypothetical protein
VLNALHSHLAFDQDTPRRLWEENLHADRGVDRRASRGNYVGTPGADIPCDAIPLDGMAPRFLPSERRRESYWKAEMLSALDWILGRSRFNLSSRVSGLQDPETVLRHFPRDSKSPPWQALGAVFHGEEC